MGMQGVLLLMLGGGGAPVARFAGGDGAMEGGANGRSSLSIPDRASREALGRGSRALWWLRSTELVLERWWVGAMDGWIFGGDEAAGGGSSPACGQREGERDERESAGRKKGRKEARGRGGRILQGWVGAPVVVLLLLDGGQREQSVGIYLPSYDLLRNWIEEYSDHSYPKLRSYAPLIAGSIARSLACITCSPIELARTRMQAFKQSSGGAKTPGMWKTMILLVLAIVSVTYYAVVLCNYGPALLLGGGAALAVLLLFHFLELQDSRGGRDQLQSWFCFCPTNQSEMASKKHLAGMEKFSVVFK